MRANETTTSSMEKARSALVARLVEDMPLLQHGSGDVVPSSVNFATSAVLANLTSQYVSNLVDAALDAQQVLCDASEPNALPPPVFARHAGSSSWMPPPRLPSLASAIGRSSKKKRRRKANEEYWDEPVVPKIRKSSDPSNSISSSAEEEDALLSSALRWVGAAGGGGPDAFRETSRVRASYVRGPHALAAHSFVFPVCHDTYAYNRILEVQSAKRGIEPLLMVDPTLADLVRTEGHRRARARPLKKTATNHPKKKGAAASAKSAMDDPDADDDDDLDDDPDEEDEEEEEAGNVDGPMWPGLASILPVHRRAYENLARNSGRDDPNAGP
jgi:hypothetical protein